MINRIDGKNVDKGNVVAICFILALTILIFTSIILRSPKINNDNYRNSNAT